MHMLTKFSAVFQAGGLVVVLVEVNRKPYLASIVPVIVNAILNEHQIIVDIVAFVNKGDFPRSRLGEKQRGKILGGWVSRKLRTLAQFSIRDMDAESTAGDMMDPSRASMVSVRSGGGVAPGSSSLRNVEPAPQILEEEHDQMTPRYEYDAAPTMISELPDGQETPTGFQRSQFEHPPQSAGSQPQLNLSHQPDQGFDMDFSRYSSAEPDHNPLHRRPVPGQSQQPEPMQGHGQAPPQIRLPGVDGREEGGFWSQQEKNEKSQEDWTADAMMHMNLAGDMGPPR
jgi:hypothetical protein